MQTQFNEYIIPFWISSDYFEKVLDNDPRNINLFPELQKVNPEINKDHSDLHVYPYTKAIPAILSMGCNNQCSFCPTAHIFKGRIYYGDYEKILPNYENLNVHFLDENFFHNDMKRLLPLLKKYNIKWLSMGHFEDVMRTYDEFGEEYLYDCGLRVIEIGLENISLMRKVKGNGVPNRKVEIYYLNLSLLPGETKETIKETAEWMKSHSLRNPIYYNNALWYSPGQYYFPYEKKEESGILLKTKYARIVPTYVPDSLLDETVTVLNCEIINKYVHFMYTREHIFTPAHTSFKVREFVGKDYRKVMWIVVGIRIGAIV